MEKCLRTIIAAFVAVSGMFAAQTPLLAQDQQQKQLTPEEQEKQLNEFILKEVDRLETTLKLEDWQVFYVDSILTHDYHAMQTELTGLSSSKVSNYDLYAMARDKWAEQMYGSFQKVFNDEQWAKYLKSGAARDKRARDKRKAKNAENTAKLQNKE